MNPKFKPSKIFFRYLKKEYSYTTYGYNSKMSEKVLNELLASAYGFTAWLFTKNGARWVFKLYGVEELTPHFAFNYWYTAADNTKHRFDPEKMVIFSSDGPQKADILKEAQDITKKVIYAEGWKVPEARVVHKVISLYRDWLKTDGGKAWAKDSFACLQNIFRFGGLTYKYAKGEGNIYWAGGNRVSIVANEFKPCDGCDLHTPCVDEYTGLGALCNRCYAENFADKETLGACCRFECKLEDCNHYLTHVKFNSVLSEVENLPIQWGSNESQPTWDEYEYGNS